MHHNMLVIQVLENIYDVIPRPDDCGHINPKPQSDITYTVQNLNNPYGMVYQIMQFIYNAEFIIFYFEIYLAESD